MMPRLRALLAMLLLLATGGAAMAELATIEGTATYRERLALPEGAVLEVELLDISRADSSAERLASLRVKPEGQVPIAFTLHYDPALIDQRFTYAVTARILHEGRMLFRADTVHHVLTRGGGDTVDILMVRVAGDAPAAVLPMLVGPAWVAEDIDNRGVLDRLQSRITFTPESRVEGMAGCNGFGGGYVVDGDRLEIGGEGRRLVSTLRACAPAIMDQEARFHDALGQVRFWRINMGLLFLLDAEGTPIIRLWRGEI